MWTLVVDSKQSESLASPFGRSARQHLPADGRDHVEMCQAQRNLQTCCCQGQCGCHTRPLKVDLQLESMCNAWVLGEQAYLNRGALAGMGWPGLIVCLLNSLAR